MKKDPYKNLPVPIDSGALRGDIIEFAPMPYLLPGEKGRAGRKSRYRIKWNHPSTRWRERITFFIGIKPGNRFIYIILRDDEGNLLIPGAGYRSLHILLPGDEDKRAQLQVAIDACDTAEDCWHQAKNEAAMGVRRITGRNLFGYFAKQVIRDLELQAIEHGYLPRGELRDEMWPELKQVKSKCCAKRYDGSRGGRWTKENRELLAQKQKELADAAIARGIDPDKGKSFAIKISNVRRAAKLFGHMSLKDITNRFLNDFAANLRVTQGRHQGDKWGRNQLGQLNEAIVKVWAKAVEAKAVPEDDVLPHPRIKWWTLGRIEGDKRAKLGKKEIEAIADYINGSWAEADFDLRLELLYVAMLACTGIRTGLEILSIRIGQIDSEEVEDANHGETREVHTVEVKAHAGKHPDDRTVTIFQGLPFPIIEMLASVIAHWKRKYGVKEYRKQYLFGPARSGRNTQFRHATKRILDEAGVLEDADRKQRTGYCLRSFFGTTQILKGRNLLQVAKWMGTSLRMLEKHYYRDIALRDAWQIDGWTPDKGYRSLH